jgi:hypothetical protein
MNFCNLRVSTTNSRYLYVSVSTSLVNNDTANVRPLFIFEIVLARCFVSCKLYVCFPRYLDELARSNCHDASDCLYQTHRMLPQHPLLVFVPGHLPLHLECFWISTSSLGPYDRRSDVAILCEVEISGKHTEMECQVRAYCLPMKWKEICARQLAEQVSVVSGC